MAHQLYSVEETLDLIQGDSDSGSEPNFSDSDDDFEHCIYLGQRPNFLKKLKNT